MSPLLGGTAAADRLDGFYCDLNVEESARVLGCTAGTVKSQTSRALAVLRQSLGREPGASDEGTWAMTRRPEGGVSRHA